MIENIQMFDNYCKTKYNFDWITLEPIFEQMVNIDEQDYLEGGGALTSYKNIVSPLVLPELSNFYEYINPIYKEILIERWNYPVENEYIIGGAWISKYGKGGFIKPHNHDNIVAVICAYIQIPKNSSNIFFRDSNYETKKTFSTNGDDWLWKEIECQNNDVLIFHGGNVHKTKPNESEENRWVLTSNVTIKKTKLI